MFYKVHSNFISVSLKVTTRAPRNEYKVPQKTDERFLIKIRALREKGQANEELIAYISSIFNIPIRSIQILRGTTAQLKVIALHGIDEKSFLQKIGIS